MALALQRAKTDPEESHRIHEAGAKQFGGLWLRANIAAVNAANAYGLPAEQNKVPIAMIVLKVLHATRGARKAAEK